MSLEIYSTYNFALIYGNLINIKQVALQQSLKVAKTKLILAGTSSLFQQRELFEYFVEFPYFCAEYSLVSDQTLPCEMQLPVEFFVSRLYSFKRETPLLNLIIDLVEDLILRKVFNIHSFHFIDATASIIMSSDDPAKVASLYDRYLAEIHEPVLFRRNLALKDNGLRVLDDIEKCYSRVILEMCTMGTKQELLFKRTFFKLVM